MNIWILIWWFKETFAIKRNKIECLRTEVKAGNYPKGYLHVHLIISSSEGQFTFLVKRDKEDSRTVVLHEKEVLRLGIINEDKLIFHMKRIINEQEKQQ